MTKTLQNCFLIATFVFTFFSCINIDSQKEKLTDAYICSKIMNGDTVYALEGYVKSNYAMKSVVMKNPDQSLSFNLLESSYSAGYFEKEVKDEDFKLQKPATGNYLFEISYQDGTSVEATDYLSSDILEPIGIKSVTPDSVAQSVVVEWVDNTKADYYTVRFLKHDSIIFLSDWIDPSFSSIKIYASSYGWATNITPEAGDSLKVIVAGILLETGNTVYLETQSVSFSLPVGVVWPD